VNDELRIGDCVCMSAFHWVFEVAGIDGDDVTLRTPYGALASFPRNTMSRTTEPFEARWGDAGPIHPTTETLRG